MDLAFLASTVFPAASAAYSVMTTMEPALPAGFALRSVICADHTAAADQMISAPAHDTQPAVIALAESSRFGVVLWDEINEVLVIAIRGTKTAREWVADFAAAPARYAPLGSIGFVHLGFSLVYAHIRQAILDAVQRLVESRDGKPPKRTVVVGHSLGGAEAIYAALDIRLH